MVGRIFLLVSLLMTSALVTPRTYGETGGAPVISDPSPDWKFVERKLKAAKFKKSFIKALKAQYEEKAFLDVLELNVLLFLRKSDYHGVQVTDDAVAEVQKFVQDHSQPMGVARKKYGVPGELVASLLWIESRYGKNLGTYHVPSVFLHLIQANRGVVIEYLKSHTARFTDKITKAERREIAKRTQAKARWAISELKALEKMHLKDPHLLQDLRGSFAGAYGMPQFLPSSYLVWAKSAKKGKSAKLEQPEDAILSVANYLKSNGWRPQKKNSHMKALLHYNNSSDYANAILKLADLVREKDREPSSTKKND
jgi:membrane-bound lytic murein transglycosylase B